jgi:hypothetical protein
MIKEVPEKLFQTVVRRGYFKVYLVFETFSNRDQRGPRKTFSNCGKRGLPSDQRVFKNKDLPLC